MMLDFLRNIFRKRVVEAPKGKYQHPTFEELTALKLVPGYERAEARLENARNLVSFTPECFSVGRLQDVSAHLKCGLVLHENDAMHLRNCSTCRDLLRIQ
jgi:hypothetical protein